ncbi:MAG: DUF4838 domain-containing protein [Ruminococcaceae bacterium]|nr:DUF4838 domain-containing protein [Oscillospiraceae bacterium]
MKKIISLILCAIMVHSFLVSCGEGERETAENGTETAISETRAPEGVTETAGNLIAENGEARAHIVISGNASELEKYAAEELAYHTAKVSGAQTEIVTSGKGDGLPIIIATPHSLPEIAELFPEDIAWLRETGEEGSAERYGDDGFAIRQLDGAIYIFGVTPRGALNGVYDFIEENMGVLWTRADEETGLIYDEMPTVTAEKVDYREKSPFGLRGWTLAMEGTYAYETEVMLSRNKMNASMTRTTNGIDVWQNQNAIGIEPFISNHNIKWWITESPSYDPDCREYWSTDENGNHAASAAESSQVNIWSDVTVEVVADHVIAFLDEYKLQADIDYVGICLEDWEEPFVCPEQTASYEYAPGQFVEPSDSDYLSTVFYSFMNKIARRVAEKHSDVIIHTYAYTFTEKTPRCGIEDNLYITFCTYFEDLCFPTDEPKNSFAEDLWDNLQGWSDKTKKMIFYNYYGCFSVSPVFERPIWSRMQADFRYYAENGFHGMVPEGVSDLPGHTFRMTETPEGEYFYTDVWEMNTLTFWLYSKLAWNPEEDIDALIDYFCEKCYGDAAEPMREYYRLLELGWEEGAEYYGEQFNSLLKFYAEPWEYYYNFLDIEADGVYIFDALKEALDKAWNAADDTVKERIRQARESYENWETFVQ